MKFITSRRVEFRDTDAAGIVHFSAFFPMMEAGEHELLRSLGIAILPRSQDGESSLTWPRVSASCDYKAAARFEDILRIEVTVAKIGNSSIQYAFRFFRDPLDGPDAALGEATEVAVGTLTAVACRLSHAGGLEKVAIPSSIRSSLSKYAGD